MATKGPTKVPIADLTELLRPYPSGWVALSSDEDKVVGAGETLQEARDRAIQDGYLGEPIFVKVIPQDQGYAPTQL